MTCLTAREITVIQKEKILSIQEVENNVRVSLTILIASLRVNPLLDLSAVRLSNDGKLRMG